MGPYHDHGVGGVQGMGLHGVPMGNMSNQQLMQMQLHGMDLQRMGMGVSGGITPHSALRPLLLDLPCSLGCRNV